MAINSVDKIVALANKRREDFISKRSLLERELDTYRENLSKLSEETLKELGIDISHISAKTMFPSLYSDKFDEEAYTQERIAYGVFMGPIVTVRAKLLARAEELSRE